MTDRYKDDAEFLRRMANHKQLDWLIPDDRERMLRIANVLAAVPDAIDEALESLERQLAEADELIDANKEWALPDAVRLASFYDAALARHRARKTSSTDGQE